MKIPSPDEINKSIARKSHLEFMRYTWLQSSPFVAGFHTEEISKWLDEAFEKYRNGISSYGLVSLHPRSGKSQLISRSAIPHFLGEFPQGEVICTSYNQTTVEKFSKDAKTIIDSPKFKELYPDCRLNQENKGVKNWGLDNRVGSTLWSGIDGSLTGNGAHFGIVDDAYKGRAELSSEKIVLARNEAFTESFLTRLAPIHICLVVGTRWAKHDLHGLILDEMEKNPNFPKFDQLIFPAKAEDYKGAGKYRGKYLFPERFPDSWYESQYSFLGAFASSALFDCRPTPKGGNILPAKEGVNWHYVDTKPEGFTRLVRSWDLASTAKMAGNDPDWTVGIKLAVKVEITKIVNPYTRKVDHMKKISIYIDDIVRIREDAVKRNNKMIFSASEDGAGCINLVEAFGAQKDTVALLRSILGGSRIVKGVKHKGDKDFKITEALEVPFSNGNVFVNRKIDKDVWKETCRELEEFPYSLHDDQLDSLAIGVTELTSKQYQSWWA